VNAIYPVAGSSRLPESRDFYRELLGLAVAFENDWYVGLIHPGNPALQLGFVASDHDSVPAAHRVPARGVLVTVEVDDVDAVHERARSLGLPMELELRDEDWGQRHFITSDPNGLLVDVVQVIRPSDEFAASYAPGMLG
jgi:catechol 2,3-dioxygenase-like lactoylglutathione lyase family enzyme